MDVSQAVKSHFENVQPIKCYLDGNIPSESSQLKKSIDSCWNIFGQSVSLAIIGRVNSGKSLLASALVDKKVILPSRDGVTTVRTTRLVYSNKQQIRELNYDGQKLQTHNVKSGILFEKHKLSVLDMKINLNRNYDIARRYYNKLVEIGLDCDLLKSGLQIIDFPPLNENILITSNVLKDIGILRPTIVCYVYDCNQGFNLVDMQMLLKIHEAYPVEHQKIVQYILVGNKIDGEDENDFDTNSSEEIRFNMTSEEKSVKHCWESFPKEFDNGLLFPIIPLSAGMIVYEDDSSDSAAFIFSDLFRELQTTLIDRIEKQSRYLCQSLAGQVASSDLEINEKTKLFYQLKKMSTDPTFIELIENSLSHLPESSIDFGHGYKLFHVNYREENLLITSLSKGERDNWEEIKERNLCNIISLEEYFSSLTLEVENPELTLCWIERNVPLTRLVDCYETLDAKSILDIIEVTASKHQILNKLILNFRLDTIFFDPQNRICSITCDIPNDIRLPLVLKDGERESPLQIHPSLRVMPHKDGRSFSEKQIEFIYSFGCFMKLLIGCSLDQDINKVQIRECFSHVKDAVQMCCSINTENSTDVLKVWFDVCRALGSKYQLSSAIVTGNEENVSLAIRSGEDVNQKIPSGDSCLHLAAIRNEAKIMQILLQNNADVNIENDNGITPLLYAIHNVHLECVHLLIRNNADTNKSIKGSGATPLFVAAESGNLEIISLLLEKGAEVDVVIISGETPLQMSAERGHFECLKLLLSYGASVDMACKQGVTALFLAAERGYLDIVQILLQHKAKVNISRNSGANSVHIASQNGHHECLSLLIQTDPGAMNAEDCEGYTPLVIAAQRGQLNCLKILLGHGANVDHQSKVGITATFLAAQEGHTECLELLLKYNANMSVLVKSMDPKIESFALHIATQEGNLECLKLLLEAGADVNIALTDGLTAAHMACHTGQLHCLRLLIQYEANVNLLCSGHTPLSFAVFNDQIECIKLLLSNNADPDINNHEDTNLHVAAEMELNEIMAELLKYSPVVNCRNEDGNTPLHIAVQKNNSNCCKQLILAGANPYIFNSSDETVKDIAQKNNFQDILTILDEFSQTQ